MNERIREILSQCQQESIDGPEYPQWTDLEKFAELIVRQCGYYADIFESAGCPVDMDPTETKPSDYIKKHFGVNNGSL